jgi:hypothetical protein
VGLRPPEEPLQPVRPTCRPSPGGGWELVLLCVGPSFRGADAAAEMRAAVASVLPGFDFLAADAHYQLTLLNGGAVSVGFSLDARADPISFLRTHFVIAGAR